MCASRSDRTPEQVSISHHLQFNEKASSSPLFPATTVDNHHKHPFTHHLNTRKHPRKERALCLSGWNETITTWNLQVAQWQTTKMTGLYHKLLFLIPFPLSSRFLFSSYFGRQSGPVHCLETCVCVVYNIVFVCALIKTFVETYALFVVHVPPIEIHNHILCLLASCYPPGGSHNKWPIGVLFSDLKWQQQQQNKTSSSSL